MKKEIRKTGLFALIGLVGILSSCGGDSSVTSASGAGPSSTKPSSVAPSNSEPDPVGGGEYTFEAEYTDVSNLSGGGISGAAVGINMILQSGNASNGWYIGYTHKKGLAITFEITSSAAAKADLTLILGTELGPMVMNPMKPPIHFPYPIIAFLFFASPKLPSFSTVKPSGFLFIVF